MSIYIDHTFNYSAYESFKQPLSNSLKIIPRDVIVFLVFATMFIMIKSIDDITNTIYWLYTSFILIMIYGYIQVFSIFNIAIFQSIYDVIWPLIDSGWAGEDRRLAYIYGLPRRINITMPEASEVSHYFQSAIYPFLLASVISRYTMYKKKVFDIPVEFYIFMASMPLLLFTISSAGYFILAAQISLALILYLKYYGITKKLIWTLTLVGMAAAISIFIVATVFYEDIAGIDLDVISKVFSTENGSSNTRYALALAGLGVFYKFPLFGTGPANTNFFMEAFIPNWAKDNYEIINAIQTQAIPTLNYWVELLATVGILGSAIYFYLMYKTIKPYIMLTVKTEYDIFLKCSFYLYLLSTVMHGFNSSSMAFIYIWVLWAFYICLITTKISLARWDQ